MALTKISTGMLKQDAASSDLNIDAGTLYLDVSNNRVGVANTSPTRALHVSGIAKTTVGLEFGNGPSYLYESATDSVALRIGSDGPYLEFIDVGSNVVEMGNASGPLALTASGTEAVRIDGSGNVGIGTTNTTGNKLYSSSTSGHAATFYSNSGGTTTGLNAYGITLTGNMSNGSAEANIVYGSSGGGLAFNSFNGTTATERMRIDSSGNVGIGTASPSAPLEVNGSVDINSSVNGDLRLRIRNTNTGANSVAQLFLDGQGNNFYINNYGDGTSNANITEFKSTAGSSQFVFSPQSSEAMRINSSGNVGIGESAPDEALVVRGGAYSINQDGGIAVQAGDASGNHLKAAFKLKSNSGGNFRTAIDATNGQTSGQTFEAISIAANTGNVGIGTSSPAQTLHVSSSSATSNGIRISNSECSYEARVDDGEFYLYDVDDARIPLLVNTSGNTVIGSTTAKTRLQVSGAGAANAPSLGSVSSNVPLYLTNADTAYGLVVGTNSSTGNAWLQAQRTDGTATAYDIELNTAGGNVGIGAVDPAAKIHVNSAGVEVGRFESTGTSGAYLTFQDADTTQKAWIGSDGDLFKFYSDNSTLNMTMTTNGNVGIGGSPSGKKFEVIQDSGDAEMRLRITDGASNQSFFFYGNYTGPDQNIYFGDSTNTAAAGIRYSHSVDAMRFTGKGTGTEMARFDSSGNFGIGLTNLGSAKFEVYPGTAANAGAIRTSYGSAWMNIITNLSTGGFNPVSLSGDMGIIFSLDGSSSSASSNGFVIAPWSGAAGGIRIKDNGYVGISVSNASYPLDVKGTIQIQDDGASGYTHSRLITQSANASRGSGMFMHNTANDIEWYAGRPYSSSDNFVIARQSTASHADSTAQLSNSFVVVTSSGNLLVGETSSSSSTYKFETSSGNSTGARINTVSLGRSSTGYPVVGYNCAPTTTVNTYNKVINDYASWFHFVSGGIDTYTTTTTGTGTTTGTAGPYLSRGGTSWTSSSDRRLKNNIEGISYGLEAVKSLNPVSYVRNDRNTGATELGFIAQEVDEVVSEVVSVKDDGYYGIDYERLIPVLTKAIQEQQEIIENLKSRIEQLEQ